MAIELPKKKVTISVGQPGNLAKSEDQTLTLKELAELLEKPLTTSEKFHQYKDGSHAYKQGRKASAGWFIRCPVAGGIRNRKSVGSSHVITFDMDDVPPEYVQRIRDGGTLPDYAMIVHSTRSHTPEEPRLRLMLFVDDAIPPEEYNRVSRIVGVMIDKKLKHIDPVSFRPAQMMFRPSVSRDMEKHYVFHTQNGALLDWEDEVRRWEKETGLDSQDICQRRTAPGENKLRESAEKAEDPLTKEGAVGDFCRAWSITELIQGKEDENGNHHEGPLKDVYQIDDWENGNAARMTYLGGHSTNGAVVYEDKFVYSHHGSDPASDALLNAYDLVRVHKFGDRDDKIADDAPMKDRPSVKAMYEEHLKGDVFYKDQAVQSRFGVPEDMLSEDDAEPEDEDEDEDPLFQELEKYQKDKKVATKAARRRLRAKKPSNNWLRNLNLNENNAPKKTVPNAAAIVTNDHRMFRKIAYNEFTNEVSLLDDFDPKSPIIRPIRVKDKAYGDRWQDYMTTAVKVTIELESGKKGAGGYDTSFADNTIREAIQVAARQNTFHPIKDYFDDLREGNHTDEEVVDTFFIRHCGVPDTIFTREATRLMAIAAVARIEEPGCKFDYSILLEGPQGIGKSTIISRLFGSQWFGEISSDIGNPQRVAESLQGVWAAEFAELNSLRKAEANELKQFLSRVRDDVRMAYGREVSDLPRQTVFFGTTNDKRYLKDRTGNRRFWPFPCGGEPIDAHAVAQERDVFWRTAHALYTEMREAQPSGNLPLFLSPEAEKIAEELQGERIVEEAHDEWVIQVLEWMDRPMRLQELLTQDFPEDFALMEEVRGHNVETTMVQRIAFNRNSALTRAFEGRDFPPQENHTKVWGRVKEEFERLGWGYWSNQTRIGGRGGPNKHWFTRPDMTQEEKKQGFRVIDTGAEPLTESDHKVDDPDDLLSHPPSPVP